MDQARHYLLLAAISITVVLVVPMYCSPCGVFVVDQLNGSDCSMTDSVIENITCNSLEDVFSLIEHSVANNTMECYKVTIGPGTHTVYGRFVFTRSIKLLAEQNSNVTVRLDIPYSEQPSQEPDEIHYALFFLNITSEVVLDGIDFTNSSGIINFLNVTTVSIKNCSFRYFSQSAVHIYNSPRVFVLGSTFEKNGPALFVKKQAYSAYACGLSLSFADDLETTSHNLVAEVVDCVFRDNLNVLPKVLVRSTSDVITNFQFTGRGGGCALIVKVSRPLQVLFENVLFVNNEVQSFGGGFYLAVFGSSTHSITLNKLDFQNNKSPIGGGGMEIAFFGDDSVNMVEVNMSNSCFANNQADYGGGICLSFPGSVSPGVFNPYLVRFENSTFISNVASEFGAALGIISLRIFENRVGFQPAIISSCTFDGNIGNNGGILSTAYIPLQLYGHNSFNNNSGRALVNIGSLISIYSRVDFFGNNAEGFDGGALFSTSLGQFKLFRGADLHFERNQGLLGSAVIVQNEVLIPDVFSNLWQNPLCFLLYEDDALPPDSWNNVSISFSSNVAMVASAAYISVLNTCAWNGNLSPFFDLNKVMRWNFVNYTRDNQNTAHTPFDFEPDWYVQTPAVDLVLNNPNITMYPGEVAQLGLQALDELGRPTASIVRVSDSDGQSHFNIRPSLETLDYIFNRQTLLNISATVPKDGVVTENPMASIESIINHKTSATPKGYVNLTFSGCPAGYVLAEQNDSPSHLTCTCNDEGNTDIVTCEETHIILHEQLWATQAVTSQELAGRLVQGFQLVTYPCPPRYCQCTLLPYQEFETATTCKYIYDNSQQDSQCHCDREGVLCGGCRNYTAVTVLLNNCVSCSDAFWLLVVLLALVDVVLFICFFCFVKHFFTWVYPSLFYLQILPYLTEHFPWTFESARPYLYYVSSGLSFYFPYDFCLGHDLSPLASYTLRFLPFLLAVVTIGVLLTTKYFIKKPRKPWAGLQWITVMMYTHVIHTSISVLNCPALPSGHSQDFLPRWYVDGSVTCFHGWHAALGLLSVIVLLLSVAVIPVLAVYSCNCLKVKANSCIY